MLYLLQSNQLESLADRLQDVIAAPTDDPLAPETIVVQNTGMGRWLSHRIATRTGIAANIEFPLPARFIWRIFASQLKDAAAEDSFDRQIMHWRILHLLSGVGRKSSFAGLAGYLADDRDGRKAFQLAGKIADLFDQYLVYRPDMLLEWESGDGQDWQADLWRQLSVSHRMHRARLLQRFRQKYTAGALDPVGLPQRVCLFGLSMLAPVYLEVIEAVSAIIDVHLFYLNPCRQYWADLASDAEMARRRRGWRRRSKTDVSSYYDAGNPLLASLGRAGQDFLHQLVQLEVHEKECFTELPGNSLLQHLQRDILDLEDRAVRTTDRIAVPGGDRSVQLHSCYSRLREIQVLHDRLLELFMVDPDLKPGDILVMAPDIEAYAYAVQAVFDSAPRERFIPWSLADRSLRSEQPLADSFRVLFELSGGRAGAAEVIGFLESEPVLRTFGIQEEQLATIRRWIRESRIRWGFGREHRQDMGLDITDLHTWSYGLDRLLMGYCSGTDGPLLHSISPCGPISSEDAVLLGRLAEFLDRLQESCRALQGDKSPDRWGTVLLQVLDDFFDPGSSEDDQLALTGLRESVCRLMDRCREAGFTGTISHGVLQAWLREELSTPSGGQAFLAGRVTFCNMVPMRSIPFAVICLLGMNDDAYPRVQSRVSFDLMADNPRAGDRNRRDDDRYLFLESLISARKVFYISWIGRDQQDNSSRSPSVVVSELLDYVQRGFRPAAGGNSLPLVTEHPLQPFSYHCFDGSPATGSFAAEWLPCGDPVGKTAFLSAPLPQAEDEWRTVDLRQLKRFWAHPVRFFLQERLGLSLLEDDDLLPEKEPFVADALERYHLVGRLVQDSLAGKDEHELFLRLQAGGELPHGSFGINVFQEVYRIASEMTTRFASFTESPREAVEVDLRIGQFRLTGWLDGLYAAGCVRYRPASLKGRDRLQLWVEHLVLNCLEPLPSNPYSVHLATDRTFRLLPVEGALAELHRLLSLYWEGLREPLPFYPESALAWHTAKNEAQRDAAAERTWNSSFQYRGEGDDLAYRIALQGREPFGPQFQSLAAAVYGPLHRYSEVIG